MLKLSLKVLWNPLGTQVPNTSGSSWPWYVDKSVNINILFTCLWSLMRNALPIKVRVFNISPVCAGARLPPLRPPEPPAAAPPPLPVDAVRHQPPPTALRRVLLHRDPHHRPAHRLRPRSHNLVAKLFSDSFRSYILIRSRSCPSFSSSACPFSHSCLCAKSRHYSPNSWWACPPS